MIFHLGCGRRRRPLGFPQAGEPVINVDCRDLPGVDQVGDVADIAWLVARYGQPEKIAAEDVLEHLPRRRARRALSEWIACLRPGGTIHVRTPDLLALAEAFRDGRLTATRYERRLYGDQDYPENVHRCGFTLVELVHLFEHAGLTVTRTAHDHLNAWIWGRKPA